MWWHIRSLGFKHCDGWMHTDTQIGQAWGSILAAYSAPLATAVESVGVASSYRTFPSFAPALIPFPFTRASVHAVTEVINVNHSVDGKDGIRKT